MSASTERKNRLAAREAGTDKKQQAAQEAAKKAAVSKRRWTIGTIATILVIALIVFLSSPAMCRIVTAETIGTTKWTPTDVHYAMQTSNYNAYVSYNLQDYADQALNTSMLQTSALLQYAQEKGITLTDTEKEAVTEALKTLPEAAASYNVSVSRFISEMYGRGANRATLTKNMQNSILTGKASLAKSLEFSFTDEELDAYYDGLEGGGDLFDYAAYLVKTDETVTDAEAQATAEAIVMSFKDGEGEDYVQRLNDILAAEIPEASATASSGVSGSSLNSSYKDWLMGESREAGDVFAAKSTANDGYYVVLFLGRSDNTETVVSVRHILIKAEASEDGTYTDEAKAAAKARAEELLEAWKAAGSTELDFASLALVWSEDSGSSSNGGLYRDVHPGEMVPEFDAFCFADHQYGDTAIVYGESPAYAGYHIIFYVGSDTARHAIAAEALTRDATNAWLAELTLGLEPVRNWGYRFV